MRTYMPPAHADFISALAEGPSIKDYGMFWGLICLEKYHGVEHITASLCINIPL